jgi:adenylosuccinate synthase
MKSVITVGLGFGDEGKGTVVDALVRRYDAKLVIRYNGGAQCAHNVVTDDGRHHEFHQFGSGTLVPGCQTLLTKDVLVNPLVMFTEAKQLEHLGVPNALKRMFIDDRALVTTPFHRALNRLREYARGEGCHGSCGMGIGETMADAIRRPHGALRIGDLLDQKIMREKLNRTRNEMVALAKQLNLDGRYEDPLVERELSTFDVPLEEIVEKYNRFSSNVYILDRSQVSDLLDETAWAIFEGAQGVLLDENHGFHPHTTWSTTTSTNAHTFLQEFGRPPTSPSLASSAPTPRATAQGRSQLTIATSPRRSPHPASTMAPVPGKKIFAAAGSTSRSWTTPCASTAPWTASSSPTSIN